MTLTTLQLSEPFGRVTYRDAGAGEPVVLIHGVGMQSVAWEPQSVALAHSHRVIAVDMPGHGGSARLAPGPQLPDYVAWIAAVVEGLRLGPVNVAGHSMGALIAAGFAVQRPDLTRRVALINGVYCRDTVARAAVVARAASISAGEMDIDTPLKRWFGYEPKYARLRETVAGWLNAMDRGGYSDAYGAFARGDATYAEELAGIACPLLALTADGDGNSTPEMSRTMAGLAPRGRVQIVPGHRHMVNLTATKVVTDALRDWLAQPEQQEAVA